MLGLAQASHTPQQALPHWLAPPQLRPAQPVQLESLLPGFDRDRSFVPGLSAQVLQRLLGRQLFRFLFRSAFGPGHVFRLALALDIDSCFYSECLAMIRPLFLHCDIDRLLSSARLQKFLQRRFVVRQAEFIFSVSGNCLQLGFKNLPDNELPRLFQSRIQIHGSDYGFNGVGKQRSF